MKFSTRTTYGLRAMIELAKQYDKGCISLASISQKEKISQKYLERLFSGLKKAGLVKAEMGTAGGYTLTADPRQIPVYDIVKSLEGKMSPFYCLNDDGKIYCAAGCHCGATKVLVRVQEAVNKTLRETVLADLV